MKNFTSYILLVALGVLMFGGITHGAYAQVFLNGITPSPSTTYYYTPGEAISVNVLNAIGGSGTYSYNWIVASGSCPNAVIPANIVTANTFASFVYTPTSLTSQCQFYATVLDANAVPPITSQNSAGETTGNVIVVSGLTGAASPSVATTANSGQSIPINVVANGGTGSANYIYAWSSSCPGFINPGSTNSFPYTITPTTSDCSFSVQVNDPFPLGGTSPSNTFATALITVANAPTNTPTNTPFTVTISNNAIEGNYLTNATGWALYMYTSDVQNSGTSTCYGECATVWPPFYVSNLVLPSTLSASSFNTITRTDGSNQLTYLGYPLYTYEFDTGPGTTIGQGSGSTWYLMTPTGPDVPGANNIFTLTTSPGYNSVSNQITYHPVGSVIPITVHVNNLHNGAGNYIYNWSVNAGSCPDSNSLPTDVQSNSTDVFNYTPNSSATNCQLGVTAVAANDTSITASDHTGTLFIYAPLSASITPSKATYALPGATLDISAAASGGSGVYIYNFTIFNSVSLAPIANQLGSSNVIALPITSSMLNGTFEANVVVEDSNLSTLSSTTADSGVISVVSTIPPGNVTLQALDLLDSGQTEILNATITGGSGAFTYTFYNITGGKPIPSCNGIAAGDTANCSFIVNSADNSLPLSYNVIVTDTQSGDVFNSLTNSITVYKAPVVHFIATSNISNITVVPSSGSINTTSNSASLSLPTGKSLYICAAGTNLDWLNSASWASDVNDIGVNAYTDAGALQYYTSIGRQLGNVCSASTTTTSNGLIIGGVGLTNAGNYTLAGPFVNGTSKSNNGVATQSLNYNVVNADSTTILVMSSGFVEFGKISGSGTVGCTALENVTGPAQSESVYIAVCKNQAPGNYVVTAALNLSASLNSTGAISQAAYVFTPNSNAIAANQPLVSTTSNNGGGGSGGGGYTSNSASIPYGSNITINAAVTGGIGPFSFDWTINGTALSTHSNNVTTLVSAPNYLFSVTALDQGTSTTYTTTANTFNVTATGNSTTSTTTSVTTTVSNGGGGGGVNTGGGGGGGGGGASKPVVTNTTNGYTVNNIAQTNAFSLVFCGALVQATDNFVTPTSTGVTIDGATYTLNVSQPILLSALGSSCYVELTNVSYLPILQTVTLNFYNTSISNTTNATIPAIISFSLNSTKVSNPVPSYAIINVANVTASTPVAPTNYTKLEALNISLANSTNATLSLNVKVACGTNSVIPFILNGSSWKEIKPYTYDAKACSVSFAIPSDPIVALMSPVAQLPKQVQPTTTSPTTAVTTSIVANTIVSAAAPPTGISTKLLGVIAVLAIIVIVVIVIIASAGNNRNKRSRGRRSSDND